MSEGVIADSALAVSQPEASDVIAACRSAWSSVHASQASGSAVDDSALTIYTASCDKLEELGYSVEERSAELEIMLMDDEVPYDGDVQVKAAAFLNMGSTTPLNELTVVMDVSPVLEHNVCCALVRHNAKEGCLWWKVCGGTGSHIHQGLNFCGRHQAYYRTQKDTGKIPNFITNTVACSSEHGLGVFCCLSDSHVGSHSAMVGKDPGEAMASAFILTKSSRSPSRKLQARLIPPAAICNGDRPPSPTGEGGHGRMPPLGPEEVARLEQEACGAATESFNSTISEEKDDERPAGNQGLPIVSNPGARGGG